jgi:hypothetical protein
MTKLSRLGFFKRATAGAVAVGVIAAVPGLAEMRDPSEAEAAELAAKHEGALVAYVHKAGNGEIAILSGTRRTVIRDRRLVARLVKAAR